MRQNNIRILCSVIKVDLVYEAPDGSLTAFFDSTPDSPLMQSEKLRRLMREGTREQSAPFLRCNPYDAYFAGIRADGGFLYMGPMLHTRLGRPKMRQMMQAYGIAGDDLRSLPVFTLPEIRNMILLTNTVLENNSPDNEELLQLNRIISQNEHQSRREQMKFVLKEEETDDEDAVRHSYFEEQLLMQAIREGRGSDAVRLAEEMDRDSGRLSDDEVRHHRNLAVIGIALCARAAIDGGVSPRLAYRISGYYIQRCDTARDPAHLLHWRNRAIEELAGRVHEKLARPGGYSYVEKCKSYVRQHYREKLYLEQIADVLGISPGYLSKLFKRETGKCLRDYINEERVYRASNLLIYSDLSLPEIAQYVHFPTQSYFGRVFKKYKNMTPKAFRDQYKAVEYENL